MPENFPHVIPSEVEESYTLSFKIMEVRIAICQEKTTKTDQYST